MRDGQALVSTGGREVEGAKGFKSYGPMGFQKWSLAVGPEGLNEPLHEAINHIL